MVIIVYIKDKDKGYIHYNNHIYSLLISIPAGGVRDERREDRTPLGSEA